MRRCAVMIALSLALSGACTERLLLPSDKPDAGSGGTGTGGGSGGMLGSGGGGSGGRASGSGGFFLTGGTFGSGGKQGGGGMPSACGGGQRSTLASEIRRAQIVLAVGRNMSMSAPFGSNGTRMTAVQEAVRAIVNDNDRAVSFAYVDFPSPKDCPSGNSCCANSSVIYPAPDNFNAIDTAISACSSSPRQPGCTSSSSSRPIADVLRNVLMPSAGRDAILPGWTQAFERRVILLTDGPPSCSSETSDASCGNAQSQLSQLQSKNVRVHVLPISDEAEADPSGCLGRLAGGPASEPFQYHARTPMELMQNLAGIVANAAEAACEITLYEFPTDQNKVSVTVEGQPIPFDPINGWTFVQPGIIDVRGQACRDVQMASNREVVVWECH